MTRTAAVPATPPPATSGGHLVTVDGRALPLAAARLETRARGGIARTVLTQTFRNPHPEPLRVTYLLPLPHDGAVSGFAFTLGGRRVTGEVDRTRQARERFERALVEGHTAALVEQDRGSLFTQELGNLPPGAEVLAEVTVDQRLLWREGGWEWRFPATVSPRYLGAPGRVPDADRLEVPVAGGEVPARLTLSLAIEDALAEGGRVESPSHAVREAAAGGARAVTMAAEGSVPLDRDVVVRWPVAAPGPGATLAVAGRPAAAGRTPRAFGLLSLVPPAIAPRTAPRDLVLLFDVSGSMAGEPIAQSRAVGLALVEALGPGDRLELVAFSDAPVRWRPHPVEADAAGKAAAARWLRALEAGGATELRDGIREALRPLREGAQRQVVLFTDGQIGFEEEIVAELLVSLPEGSRLHTVGVGSAVNRSLTGPAARAGRGREVVIGLGEDPARAAAILVAHTALPVVTGLEIGGDAVRAVAPARPGDLHQGAPSLVALELDPRGGEVIVSGRTADGAFVRRLRAPAAAPGEGPAQVAALFGREAVEDLEARVAAGDPERARLDAAIEALGLDLGIATRLTSWVAISEAPAVDPGQPTRREVMPHALPFGVSAEGLGLRRAAPPAMAALAAPAMELDAPEGAAGGVTRLFQAALPKPSRPRHKGELKKEARPPAPPAPVHRARLVVRDLARLVVEITLAEDVAWRPPAHALLHAGPAALARRPVTLGVSARGTTRAGALAAGVVLRVVLDLAGVPDPDALDLGALELELPDGAVLRASFA